MARDMFHQDCLWKGLMSSRRWVTAEVPRFRCVAPEPCTPDLFLLLCPVVLNAPDTVLIERNVGKRIDPVTGGMMPPSSTPRDSRTVRGCPIPLSTLGTPGGHTEIPTGEGRGASWVTTVRVLFSRGTQLSQLTVFRNQSAEELPSRRRAMYQGHGVRSWCPISWETMYPILLAPSEEE